MVADESVAISLIVPCYNSSKIIEASLTRLQRCLEDLGPAWTPWELIVVDDGSRDATTEIVRSKFPSVRTLALEKNMGKGAAVRRGMLAATGKYRFFIDADAAFELDVIARMLTFLDVKEYDVVIGQRQASEALAQARPSFPRRIASAFFTFLVSRIVVTGVRDTQCGVKGFRGVAAEVLFRESAIAGFAFDVEVLYCAFKHDMDIKKVPVTLVSSGDSTVSLLRHGPEMLWQVIKIPFRYHYRRWKDGARTADRAGQP